MSDVSVIGLGAMGSALARTLVQSGREVTVWNRTLAKAKPLAELGALVEADVGDAIAASPISVVCLMNYAAIYDLLSDPKVVASLSERQLVHLSTSSPQEAEEAGARFADLGVGYLDGTIMCWPGHIGTPSGRIAVAGDENVFEDCRGVLTTLSPDLRYLGDNLRAAATLDLAFLSRLMGIICGSLHGALVCEREGVDVAQFTSILPEGDRAVPLTQTISAGTFDTISSAGASVDVASEAIAGIADHAKETGINSEFPDLLQSWVGRAQRAGFGAQETAAVIKILRQRG